MRCRAIVAALAVAALFVLLGCQPHATSDRAATSVGTGSATESPATTSTTSSTTTTTSVAASSGVQLASSESAAVIDTGLELADPSVLTVSTGYIAVGTNLVHEGELLNVPAAVSTDLERWTGYVDLLPELPSWASEGYTWAPALVEHDGRYELYFAALDSASGLLCIGVATSTEALGTYVAVSDAPLVCQTELGGSIDPEVVVTEGHRFLLWKNDGNCCDLDVRLWVQELDGAELVGARQAILSADAAWEGGVVENPSALYVDGEVQLYYSANAWDSADYGIGLAVCVGDWLNCTKLSRSSEVVDDAEGTVGSGGASVFVDRDGVARLIWHAWTTSDGQLTRTAFIGTTDVVTA